jgi:hypothetical protein
MASRTLAPAQVAANTTLPAVGETYAFANSAAVLPTDIRNTPIDWSLVTVVTVSWSGNSSTDALLDVRARGRFNGGNSATFFGLWGGFFGFTNTSSGWKFYNGQQKYYEYQMLAERTSALPLGRARVRLIRSLTRLRPLSSWQSRASVARRSVTL